MEQNSKKNLLVSVQLTRLNRVGRIALKDRNGNSIDCLAIPIKLNNLSIDNNNEMYLNMVAWESDKLKNGQTHLLKQSLPKEVVEKMSEEEKRLQPILGSVKPMEKKEKPLEVYEVATAAPAEPAQADDLPFF